MIAAAASGALIGAGVLMLVLWVSYRPTLAARITRVEQQVRRSLVPPPARTGPRPSGMGGTQLGERVGAVEVLLQRHVGTVVDRLTDASLRADLDLVGIHRRAHVAHQVLLAVAVLVLMPLPLLMVSAVTGLPWLASLWVVLLAVAAAITVPNARVRARARRVRRTFVSTLATYLELVSMRVASGSGVSEALRDASRIGSGYGWRRLRGALDDARMAGQSPATGLGGLGAEAAIPELTDLATQLELVESTGAQAEATLRAKAEALRGRQLTEMHGDANARSQTLVVGQVLLCIGFIVLIGYPAFAVVMTL